MFRFSLLFAISLSFVSVFCQPTNQTQPASHFNVQINKNVELLGFVYFLGYEGHQAATDPTYKESTRARYAYGLDLYKKYQAFENSKNLSVIIRFAENIWLDYFINLLVQIEDFPNARLTDNIPLKYYERFSPTKDSTEARINASQFITSMNRLYTEVNFDAYMKESRHLYENAVRQVSDGLPGDKFFPAMEAFYQKRFTAYNLVPSLTIPASMGFGVSYPANGKIRAFHIFGCFAPPRFADATNVDMGFGDKKHLLELSTHEFGHSFVNPVIDSLPAAWIEETKKLFDPIENAMADQAYTSWKTCLYEHFVRAGEIVIAQNLGNTDDARRLQNHYVENRKFIYLPILIRVLENFSKERKGTYADAVKKAMMELKKM